MPLLGFSMGSSDLGGIGKSLDDIIADRRKEQAKAASGRKDVKGKTNTRSIAKDKKNAIADRSIATGRAKRAAATRARRSLDSTNNNNNNRNSNKTDKKPSAMEIEKEVYRQSRKTTVAKKKAEKRATNGRVAPNSSLRQKKAPKKKNDKDPPGALIGRLPEPYHIRAAIRGMEDSGCPVPDGFQLVMQFAPVENKQQKGKGNGKQSNANSNVKNSGNQKNANRNRGGRKN